MSEYVLNVIVNSELFLKLLNHGQGSNKSGVCSNKSHVCSILGNENIKCLSEFEIWGQQLSTVLKVEASFKYCNSAFLIGAGV